jgi:hypothetical protein
MSCYVVFIDCYYWFVDFRFSPLGTTVYGSRTLPRARDHGDAKYAYVATVLLVNLRIGTIVFFLSLLPFLFVFIYRMCLSQCSAVQFVPRRAWGCTCQVPNAAMEWRGTRPARELESAELKSELCSIVLPMYFIRLCYRLYVSLVWSLLDISTKCSSDIPDVIYSMYNIYYHSRSTSLLDYFSCSLQHEHWR